MKLKRITQKRIDLEMAPLIDVVFLLLIFFLISSSFVMQPGINVKLPEASTTELQEKKDIFITVDKTGLIYLNGRKIDAHMLVSGLKGLIAEGKDRLVIIKADEEALHGQVVRVMDSAKQAGIQRIAIATSPEKWEVGSKETSAF